MPPRSMCPTQRSCFDSRHLDALCVSNIGWRHRGQRVSKLFEQGSQISSISSICFSVRQERRAGQLYLESKQMLHSPGPLHLGDVEPTRLYARAGNISGLTFFSPKMSQIFAGRDISDIAFYLQNVEDDDVSIIASGRDILPYSASSPLRAAAAAPGNLCFPIPACRRHSNQRPWHARSPGWKESRPRHRRVER